MAKRELFFEHVPIEDNMRNRTLTFHKEIELAFEIELPVNQTQFKKKKLTKNNTFFHIS